MKKIPLTQGKVALVDDEDYEWLAQFKWYCVKNRRTYYAMRSKPRVGGKQNAIQMHRIILNTPFNYWTDHINGNGLDNRKKNLRVATSTQNNQNVGVRSDNTSGFKGVRWHKENKKWLARIGVNRKRIYLGCFKNKTEAARAYNVAAVRFYGEFARLNQISN